MQLEKFKWGDNVAELQHKVPMLTDLALRIMLKKKRNAAMLEKYKKFFPVWAWYMLYAYSNTSITWG